MKTVLGMKLQDYFNDQKNINTSQADKLELYQKIMLKKYQTTRNKRPILQVRSFAYSFMIIALLVGTYGIFFFNSNPNRVSNGIFTRSHILNGVQADYIAKVVDFNGDFYIEHKGKKVQTSNIKEGDMIILTTNTELVFRINNATQAKLIGPAKCMIQKIANDEYKIEVLDGDFVEIQSIPDTENQKIELAIQDITVSQNKANQTIHFQINKEDNKHVLKNEGSDLIVTTIDNNNQTIQQNINNTQLLSIQGGDVEVIEAKTLASAIKDKNIGQIFSLVDKNPEKGTGDDIKDLQLTTFESQEDEQINEDVLNDLGDILPQEEKALLTPDQNQILRASLHANFLGGDIENIFVTYTKGDEKAYNIAIYNLEKKIKNLAKSFDMSYTNGNSLKDIANNTITIKQQLQEKYLVPPIYIQNITILKQRLDLINTYEYGSLPTEAEAKRETIKNTYSF